MTMTDTITDWYSDDALRARLADPDTMIGSRREAEIMLTVPHTARQLIAADAHRARNAGAAYRWSEALTMAANAWRRGALNEQSHADGKWWVAR